MDTIKPLFTATATATGGRNGHTQSSDGIVSADLSVPKAMGGPGNGTGNVGAVPVAVIGAPAVVHGRPACGEAAAEVRVPGQDPCVHHVRRNTGTGR